MAWVRSAVNKAVEAGGQSSIRRSLRNYADSMKLHATTAVVGGARVFHDRMVNQKFRLQILGMELLENLKMGSSRANRNPNGINYD
ncbi:hypothetical protein AHAS_Ahas12G0092100 [Arachis hypogaea]